MTNGLGPGKCDTPNCPWRHNNAPQDPKSSGSAASPDQPAGHPPADMCGDVVYDPNTWPDCKYYVDPTTYGLCPGGCGMPHAERIAAYIKRTSPRLKARARADEQFRKKSNDTNHGRAPRGQDRRPPSNDSRRASSAETPTECRNLRWPASTGSKTDKNAWQMAGVLYST